MERIPVEFEYNGTILRGFFQAVCGAGSAVWHLMINDYYFGRLRTTNNDSWIFDSNKNQMSEFAPLFGRMVVEGNYPIIFSTWYEILVEKQVNQNIIVSG